MADSTDRGFLVLADISGFTAFTTTTELEHGAEITGVLLADVMTALSPPLQIQELEGDAVFAIGPEGHLPPSQPLLDVLHRASDAFRGQRDQLAADHSCACGACSSVGALDLKMVVHHGSFVRQSVHGRSRVAGPDVILAHQLLKNDVEGSAYILVTPAALARLDLDPLEAGARPFIGQYNHFGNVRYFALELQPPTVRWPEATAAPAADLVLTES